VRELQRKLSAAGFLAPDSAEDGTFCARTHAALIAFQDSHGLNATGECDDQTWSALIEASWELGERLLFLRSPNLRGDDVAALQTMLNRLGFDCGRVDGIFGPLAVRAISDFQANVGLDVNGICTPELVGHIRRISSQTGAGPGVAAVRESVELSGQVGTDSLRIVVGTFPGAAALAHSLARRIGAAHPLTTTVDSDASTQAMTANRFRADVYIGCEVSESARSVIQYYEVPTFVSVGGRNLARRIAAAISQKVPELNLDVQGVRHPVLRETRMHAVLCSLGPHDMVGLTTNSLSTAIADALAAWLADPTHEG
jgi:N-acetylmuramoyl-L-alanine amidase